MTPKINHKSVMLSKYQTLNLPGMTMFRSHIAARHAKYPLEFLCILMPSFNLSCNSRSPSVYLPMSSKMPNCVSL